MGIDLKAGGRRTGHKSSMKVIKTQNPYQRLLIKLYKFLSRRTDSKFCATVAKRLHMSKVNAPPLGVNRLAKYMTNKDGKTAVIVGKVTDDVRMLECPKMSVCALSFSENARKRIVAAGGECITLDQLALRTGANTVLLRGPEKAVLHLPTLVRGQLLPTLMPTMELSHMSGVRDVSSRRLVVAVSLVVSRYKVEVLSELLESLWWRILTTSVLL